MKITMIESECSHCGWRYYRGVDEHNINDWLGILSSLHCGQCSGNVHIRQCARINEMIVYKGEEIAEEGEPVI